MPKTPRVYQPLEMVSLSEAGLGWTAASLAEIVARPRAKPRPPLA